MMQHDFNNLNHYLTFDMAKSFAYMRLCYIFFFVCSSVVLSLFATHLSFFCSPRKLCFIIGISGVSSLSFFYSDNHMISTFKNVFPDCVALFPTICSTTVISLSIGTYGSEHLVWTLLNQTPKCSTGLHCLPLVQQLYSHR